MNMIRNSLKRSHPTGAGWFGRLALAISTTFLLCGAASAQYGGTGGTMGTGGMATGGTPSYGSNGKAIGIGVGAAAGGAAVLYLALHHHGSVGGCVTETNDRLSFTEEKTGKTYALFANSADVKAGERVELSGRKSTNTEGTPTFEVKKVVKDLGSCR
jgi:hypothetical protein